jgi:phospholipase/carboxylesterase
MKPYLILFLHGVGADAASFQSLAQALAPALPQAEFLVPDGFQPFDGGGDGRQWFSLRGVSDANRPGRVRAAAVEVSRYADAELSRRGLTGDRLVVVGFSQGAMVAAWLALHRRPQPAAVVLLSGRVADDIAPVAGAVSTPILMAHGAQDPMIPASVVEPGARALGAWGAHVTTRIYPGLGHEVGAEELRDVQAFLRQALPLPPAAERRVP